MITLAWILFLGLLSLLFGDFLDYKENPNQQVASSRLEAGVIEIVLKRNSYGHYVANGTINGQRVKFMVDTGATAVAIPGDLASKLGLKRGANLRTHTAGGVVTSFATRLQSVGLGDIRKKRVRASIVPTMPGNEALLGMSFLKDLELIQRNNQLTLRQHP